MSFYPSPRPSSSSSYSLDNSNTSSSASTSTGRRPSSPGSPSPHSISSQLQSPNLLSPQGNNCATAEGYQAHLRAFNRRQYDVWSSFFAPDVLLLMPGVEGFPPLVSPETITGFYQNLHMSIFQEMELNWMTHTGDRIAVEVAVTSISVAEGAHDTHGFGIPLGERSDATLFMHYNLDEDGKIKRVCIAKL